MAKAAIVLTMPFEVECDDIEMMIDTNIYRSTSPWIGRITRYTDKDNGLPYWKVWYDGPQDDEATFKSIKKLYRQDLLDAFGRACADQWAGKWHGLCCLEDMLQDKSLAIGCAQDSDIVMQYACLGDEAPVYG